MTEVLRKPLRRTVQPLQHTPSNPIPPALNSATGGTIGNSPDAVPYESTEVQPMSDAAIAAMSKTPKQKSTILKGIEFEETILKQIKLLRDQIKDNRAHIKEQGIPLNAFSHVLRLRRMEDDVRRNFEENVYIIKDACHMTQTSFDFKYYEEDQKDEVAKDRAEALSPEQAAAKYSE